MESIGSFDKILSLIPGLGNAKEKISEQQMETQQNKIKGWKHAINSMTKEEVDKQIKEQTQEK